MDFGLLNSRKPQCTHLKMKTRTFTLCGSSEIVCVCVCKSTKHCTHRPLSGVCTPQGLQQVILYFCHYHRNNIKTYKTRMLWTELCLPQNGKEPACQCGRCELDLRVGKIPWRKAWQPTVVFLPGESHGQRKLVGFSPWGLKESDMTEVT